MDRLLNCLVEQGANRGVYGNREVFHTLVMRSLLI